MSDPVIVAKMYLNTRSESLDADGSKRSEHVKLGVVYGDNSVNKQWAQYTPSGHLELVIDNPEAFGKLAGGYYKVQLVPCGAED